MYKKGITLIIILLFISLSITPSTRTDVIEQTVIGFSNGKTLFVGGSGPGNYTKIQDAINDATDGDTVYVYDDSSPYYENVFVDVSITLIGEDKNNTIIEGLDDKFYTIYINDPHVIITGFTIQYSTYKQGTGIVINNEPMDSGNSHNNTIYNNIIKRNNYIGITIYGSSNNNIFQNNITNHKMGIVVSGLHNSSSHNNIYQNNIMKNRQGIYISKSLESDPNNNMVYQNNLFLNRINAIDDGSNNQWNNSKEGNFWDDYNGIDADGDGIGDDPYYISNNIKDNFPLMKPYGNITSYNKNSQGTNQKSHSTLFLRILNDHPYVFLILRQYLCT